jgi:hypothetical protein
MTDLKFAYSEDHKKQWHKFTVHGDKTAMIRCVYFEELRPYDFDICGDENVFFSFNDQTYYRLRHSWWHKTPNEWDPDYEHEITEVKAEDVPEWMRIERDWITV